LIDWFVHHHEKDTYYDNVILPVVCEYDVEVHTKNNMMIPVLELKNYVDIKALNNYIKPIAS